MICHEKRFFSGSTLVHVLLIPPPVHTCVFCAQRAHQSRKNFRVAYFSALDHRVRLMGSGRAKWGVAGVVTGYRMRVCEHGQAKLTRLSVVRRRSGFMPPRWRCRGRPLSTLRLAGAQIAVGTSSRFHDLTGALDALPGVTDNKPEVERLRATGTYGESATDAPTDPRLYPRQLEREMVRKQTSACEATARSTGGTKSRKSLCATNQREPMRSNAGGNTKATERTRTVDLRFTKPLLCQLSYGGGFVARCRYLLAHHRVGL